MSNKNVKWVIVSVSVGLVGSVLFSPGKTAHAQTAIVSNGKPTTSYKYVAKPGDNLSYIVRRSIQLYAQAKSLKISPSAAMYCETNVVQKMGSLYLDVDQPVSVPFDLLQRYIVSSRSLTPAQLSAWKYYSNQASFSLPNVNPVNKKAAQAAATPKTSSTSTTKTVPKTVVVSPSWPWKTLIVTGVIIIIYFAVSNDEDKNNSTKSGKKGTIKRSWLLKTEPAARVRSNTKKGKATTKNTRKRS